MDTLQEKNEKIVSILFILLALSLVIIFFVLMWNSPKVKSEVACVYFLKDENIIPVQRVIDKSLPIEESILKALLAGPTEKEKRDGVFSHIPKNLKVKAVSKEKDIIVVNFSKELSDIEGSEKIRSMIAQIVFTLTDIRGVKRVRFLKEGESEIVLGGEGFIINKPLERDDVKL